MASGYIGNDNVLWVTVEDIAGDADTGATCTAQIVDATGTEVEANISMPYVAARSRYEGQPDEDLWAARRHYTAIISVTGSNSEEGEIRVGFQALHRTA